MGCCTHQHKHTGRGPLSEFLFHILSAGCVMMPFIKVGNYLPALLDPGSDLQALGGEWM